MAAPETVRPRSSPSNKPLVPPGSSNPNRMQRVPPLVNIPPAHHEHRAPLRDLEAEILDERVPIRIAHGDHFREDSLLTQGPPGAALCSGSLSLATAPCIVVGRPLLIEYCQERDNAKNVAFQIAQVGRSLCAQIRQAQEPSACTGVRGGHPLRDGAAGRCEVRIGTSTMSVKPWMSMMQ